MSAKLLFSLDTAKYGEALRQVEQQLGDLTELMELLCGRVIKLITRKFAQSGPGWVPLAKRTLKRRRLKGKGGKPLLDTGRLRASLVAEGTGSVKEITRIGFRLGTNIVYAATHQYGRGRIPARPFIPTERELEAEFYTVLERYLKAVLG